MISNINENNFDVALISKIKKQTGPKKLKKIIKNLRNLAEEDVKGFSGLKIKVFEEQKEEEKQPEIIIAVPAFGLQHYLEEFKNQNVKSIVNDVADYEGENTPSTADDNEEELKQIDSSDFSDEDD